MANKYKQPNLASAVRFEKAPIAGLEFSKLSVMPKTYTTYNAGDLIPIRQIEVLPHTNIKVSVDVINRLLSAVIVPTMDNMQMDVYAYFVSNRELNESWKNVTGENTSGVWSAPEVKLAPLYSLQKTSDVKIPVGSIADYLGLPTQRPIKAEILHNMNDLIPSGYFSIWNEYFRDENYQPPLPLTKLNVYRGFLETPEEMASNGIPFSVLDSSNGLAPGTEPTGDVGMPAIAKAMLGSSEAYFKNVMSIKHRIIKEGKLSILNKPLKANKLHDPLTSALPSPQKGPEIFFGISDTAPVTLDTSDTFTEFTGPLIKLQTSRPVDGQYNSLVGFKGNEKDLAVMLAPAGNLSSQNLNNITGTNLVGVADLSKATGVSINDIRMSASIQQIYEMLGRSGSRYREFLRAFFGLNIENPFKDIPTELGHMRIDLDMYQVAQTSASVEGETAQGTLSAFGYTTNKQYLFDYTALEHGFIHFVAVVRQKNTYSSFINPSWMRRNTLDWYLPQLANISEQPVRLAQYNPFNANAMEKVVGYQESWWEYRHEVDICTGYTRTGLDQTLGSWTYADDFDPNFEVVTGDFLVSNAQEVLDRSLAVTSAVSPQFIACFTFDIEKEIPMPTYSVPGLDII